MSGRRSTGAPASGLRAGTARAGRRLRDAFVAGLRRAAATLDDLRSGGEGRPATYSYSPVDDQRADPGEVVWAWVPFEEAPDRGKDRPVLVVGRSGDRLLALPLTSKDHDRDSAQEAAAGRHWVDVGAGAWDRYHRPSEARVDRLLRLEPSAVRRVGATLDRQVFGEVMAEVRRFYPVP